MSPSSDIETLFGHFGGNAGDYQEIGRENEAGTARTRWPLLVTLDLKQTPIPPIAPRREQSAQQVGGTEAQHGEPGAVAHPAGPANPATSDTPTMRSKAPLFARPHRRNVPPVANVIKADAPRGGDRFGALPEVTTTVASLREAGAVTEPVVSMPPIAAPVAPVQPGALMRPVTQAASIASSTPRTAAMQSATPPVASAAAVSPVFSRPAATAPASTLTFASGAVPAEASRSAVAPVAPAWANPLALNAQPAAAVARTPAATQPPSILGRLFAAAAPQPAPASHARAGDARPAELNSVFDRLRGAPSSPAAAAPVSAHHSWLNNGPRRS
jgi:hypothetical protein